MNKIFNVIIFAALLIGLCACASNPPPVDAVQTPESGPDWAGVYAGVIPAASGPGINVTITLNNDLTYELQYQYIDRPDGGFNVNGTFKLDSDENLITLDMSDMANIPPYYRVAENRLVQLDMEGNPITGASANEYVLARKQ